MRAAFFTAAALAALLAFVCGQNTAYQQDPGWRAPAEAAARRNPLAHRPEAAAGGEKLFKRNCAECHGEDGAGLAKKHAADLQLPVVQEQSDGTLFWKVTNGNTDRGMPSFSRLPELQRWQLVLYLRALRGAAETSPKEKEEGR
ncbi:MAG: cytochrome c [Terriglobales bacterium]